MLDKIKLSLRINNNAYDDEVLSLIEACKLDLKISGIASSLINDTDPLIKQAIISYCKGNFGYDNPDSEKFKQSYSLLKQHLAIAYSSDNNEIKNLIENKQEEVKNV